MPRAEQSEVSFRASKNTGRNLIPTPQKQPPQSHTQQMSAKTKTDKATKTNKPQIKMQDLKPKKDAKGGAKRNIVPCI
jgi:hypothetical protein